MQNNTCIIYPRYDDTTTYPEYEQERNIAKLNGFKTGYLNETTNTLITKSSSCYFLYRGWFLPDYDCFNSLDNDRLINNVNQYFAAHHMLNWVHELKELTFKTICFPSNLLESPKDVWQEIENTLGSKAFVKTIKSNNWGSSVAEDLCSFKRIIKELDAINSSQYLYAREFKELNFNKEKRHWVIKGKVFNHIKSTKKEKQLLTGVVSTLGEDFSNFYSVDTIVINNKAFVIEIGDGQVSQLKDWTPDYFYTILKEGLAII